MKPNDIEKTIKEDGSCLILLNEYEEIRADEREKTVEECKKLVGRILKAYQDDYHFGVTFNGMCNNILNKIEQLKEQK